MKIKIHYEIKNIEDSFILDEETLDDILDKVNEEKSKRGLDTNKNNMWSERIE